MEHVSFGIINLLKKGVDKGYWTVEQIDRPSLGWQSNTKTDRRFFKNGYQGINHQNLLRPVNYEPPALAVEPDGLNTFINTQPFPDDLPF